MRILFTGGSSFTGFWFVKELAANGHEVWTTFTRKDAESYDGVRGKRLNNLTAISTPVWSCPFGGDRFVDLIQQEKQWDLLCHHAADVRDYHSLDFDVGSALSRNTANIRPVLKELVEKKCNKIVLTGSVFEQQEGAGEKPLRAFSPYGLAKGLTAEVFRFWCETMDITLGKFVIPNPFGPFEEPRFTAYLANTWLKGQAAGVRTPLYVRDNIHVSLLALSYRQFAESLVNATGFQKLNPSGYVETQGAFAVRFANEMRSRFNVACELELGLQTKFDEPKVRINTDPVNAESLGWSEKEAWDNVASYYLSLQNVV
jgi:nucleoside-diphosphate-sugar epimerase